MRELNIGTKRHTTVYAIDEPEFGANHKYLIDCTSPENKGKLHLANINFQKGPVKEHGINGIHNEDLIAIVIDRLKGFQETEFKCKDNEMAILDLESALCYLNRRTKERQERSVEGTNQI